MEACASCGAALPEGARYCPGCGAAAERPTGERKVATVLFADLVGSTALADSADPERTRARLERFYEAMADEIRQAGGTVEKFAGDAVMAAFGAPAALEDHAERALHAALSMQRRLDDVFAGALRLRIGVNSGEVVVGQAVEGSSFVSGDAVNVGARLEQGAASGEILVGERTVALVRGAFEFGEPRTIRAKGKEGGVPCRPLARALSRMRPRGLRGHPQPFVGRGRELGQLRAAYRQVVAAREPHVAIVIGDAGVGKTRLVREFWEWLGDAEPEQPTRRTGRCLSYGRGTTYWPLGEILREQFAIVEGDPPEALLSRLAGREILGLTVGLDVAAGLHPLEARDRLHEAWIDLIAELAAERPVVLLVEDVHWAEDPLLDLLQRLLRDVRGPVLLVVTGRPELVDRPGWGAGRRSASLLWLEPLSDEETGRLVDALLAATLPPSMRALVVERSEGNPLFAEELVGSLIDRGVLENAGAGWRLHEPPADFDVPDTVQAVLAARIDLLPPLEKAALQAASVVGRTFWAGPVRELLAGEYPDLALLEDRDFVRRRARSTVPGEREYVIKHALTREVAYSSLPKARRARLHAAFAGWLERAGDGRHEHVALLAHHYAEAVRAEHADLAWAGHRGEYEVLRERAAGWLRRAAELAIVRFEIDEALALLERAAELAPDAGTRAEALLLAGEGHLARFDIEAFRAVSERALALEPPPEVAARIYAQLAAYGGGRPYMWRKPPAYETVHGWIESALALSERRSPARTRALLARAVIDPVGEREAAEEGLALAEDLGDAQLLRFAYEAQGAVAAAAGDYRDEARWADRQMAIGPRLLDADTRAASYWAAAFAYLRAGRLADARRLASEHDEIAARLSPHHRVHALGLDTVLESVAGRWDSLGRLAERAEAAATENAATPCQFNWRMLLVCALGRAAQGDAGEAARLEALARDTAVVALPLEREPALLRLALLRGDLAEAERILGLLPAQLGQWEVDAPAARLDALLALGERPRIEAEARAWVDHSSYVQPFALRALGAARGDETLLRRALAGFEAIELGSQAEQTRALLAG
jgi:class 3 adenylate cyclase